MAYKVLAIIITSSHIACSEILCEKYAFHYTYSGHNKCNLIKILSNVVHRIEIYPMDSAIQLLNNRGLERNTLYI